MTCVFLAVYGFSSNLACQRNFLHFYNTMTETKNFWETKKLEQLTEGEWESLCDGCGYCCLVKLEDERNGEIANTSVACRLLDIETCQCSDYQNRLERVPMCVKITPDSLPDILARKNWLPSSCAYRLLHEGKALPDWHPLLAGSADAVHQAGCSIKFFALSEEFIHPDQILDFLVD